MPYRKTKNHFEVLDNCAQCGAVVITKNQYNPPRIETRGGKPHTLIRCREIAAKNQRREIKESNEIAQLDLFDEPENVVKIEFVESRRVHAQTYADAKSVFAGSRNKKGAYKAQGK